MSQYLRPNPAALRRIEHIVVLMLENRSFDNLLGWLYDGQRPPRGQELEGLRSDLWNPLDNIDADGRAFVERVPVRKNGAPPGRGRRAAAVPGVPDFTLPAPDPGEGFRDTNHQLFQFYDVTVEYPPAPTNLGFVNNYRNAMLYGTYAFDDAPSDPRQLMTCYTPEQTPVLSTLAKQFAVCDHWYCSVPSQTLPNRDFVHAATSCGQVNNKPDSACGAPTIFNKIQDAIAGGRKDLSWRVYSGTQRGEPFSLTRTIMTQLHGPDLDACFRSITDFARDAAKGDLPSYAFLEPQLSGPGQNDQHPPADIRPGEQLIADIYNALVSSPAWEQVLFVVTYDEHGGCYDHVGPPAHAKPPDGVGAPGQWGFTFNRFGVRVPAVLVSPWIRAGTIARPAGETPFDHTSILATIRNCFDLDAPLTARDAAAPDLSCVLTLRSPRKDRPAVTPLPQGARPSPGADAPPPNQLHRTISAALTELTGKSPEDGEDLHAFIHRAYREHFHGSRTRQASGQRQRRKPGARSRTRQRSS